jgi:hypothetical protein
MPVSHCILPHFTGRLEMTKILLKSRKTPIDAIQSKTGQTVLILDTFTAGNISLKCETIVILLIFPCTYRCAHVFASGRSCFHVLVSLLEPLTFTIAKQNKRPHSDLNRAKISKSPWS